MIGIVLFFLLAVHLAVGMLWSLLPLNAALGVRFFRFNGLVVLVLLALAIAVRSIHSGELDAATVDPRVLFWYREMQAAFPWLLAVTGATLLYIVSLPYRGFLLSRAMLLGASIAGGMILISLAGELQSEAVPEASRIVFPIGFFLSAVTLGSVMICMILGHWFLVDPGLSAVHLRKVAALFIGGVIARFLLEGYDSILVWRHLSASGVDLLSNDSIINLLFLAQRVLFGLLLPLALSWMIWQTVKIRSIQSATGILYVAVVFVLFGEFLSHYLLLSTGFPL